MNKLPSETQHSEIPCSIPQHPSQSPLGCVQIVDYYCGKVPDEPACPLDIDLSFPPRCLKNHLPVSNHNLTCCSPLTFMSTLTNHSRCLQMLSSWAGVGGWVGDLKHHSQHLLLSMGLVQTNKNAWVIFSFSHLALLYLEFYLSFLLLHIFL